jgi:hypothetical protein
VGLLGRHGGGPAKHMPTLASMSPPLRWYRVKFGEKGCGCSHQRELQGTVLAKGGQKHKRNYQLISKQGGGDSGESKHTFELN